MSIGSELPNSGQNFAKNLIPFFEFEKMVKLASSRELRILAEKLNQLGLEFDPFVPIKNDEIDELIITLGLECMIDDPFQFTNVILKKLDIIETELKKRNS